MIYRFGGFILDEKRRELVWQDQEIRLQPRLFDLLAHLLRHRDRVVSKDELLDALWPDLTVTESSLQRAVSLVRAALRQGGLDEAIRTVTRQGYRFCAELDADTASLSPSPATTASTTLASQPLSPPITRYAKSGDIHVAYHVFGDGPVDLVLAPGFVSHIDNYWDDPNMARWLTRLGRFARVAMFDKRGTGLSDRVGALPGMDERMDDVRAVMDAVGFKQAVIMGISEGGSLASLFTASHPDRCLALVLYGAFAQFSSWFPTEASLQELFDYVETDWGSGKSIPKFAPTKANDADFRQWWGKFERLGANPGAVVDLMRMNSQIDISDVLPTIQAPTLVIHRAEDVLIDVEGGRYLAEHIPGARYVELPGVDHLAWVSDNSDLILDIVEEFTIELLSSSSVTEHAEHALATVLVADVVGLNSANVADQQSIVGVLTKHLQFVLSRFRGQERRVSATGFVATFDGPARALHGALASVTAFRRLGIDIRVGLHTGEVNLADDKCSGLAYTVASSVASFANVNKVLASRTVKDLVAGSGFDFIDIGEHSVQGIPEPWHLYGLEITDPFASNLHRS